ncbi:MAG: hypothetical protein K6L74_14825 [Neptuniibacter sp.]
MDLPISTIEGIGEVFAEKLSQKDILTVTDFIEYGVIRKNSKNSLNGRERDWFNQAKLLLVDGVDKDDAEVLIRNDITIDRIDMLNPETIRTYFQSAVEKHYTKEVPSLKTIQKWQLDAVRISSSPIVVLSIGNVFGEINTADFMLKIDGKELTFDQCGKLVLSGIPNWSLIAKLYYKDNLADFLNLTTCEQYAIFKKSYSEVYLNRDASLILASPQIHLQKNHRIEFVAKTMADFSDGDLFWGKNRTGEGGFLLSNKYKVSGKTLVFNTIRDVEFAIEDNKKYILSNNQFDMEA